MDALPIIIAVVVGIAAGLIIGWLAASARAQKAAAAERAQAQAEREQLVSAEAAAQARLQEIGKQIEAQKGFLDQARLVVEAASSEALRANSQAFVERAKQTLEPVQEALGRYEEHVRQLDGATKEQYGSLQNQLRQLAQAEQQLQRETGNLVTALRRPEVRGRWGEVALRRVVQLAGLTEHCDFSQQVSATTETARLRPDMVVHLPGDCNLVVDSKVPLDAYLDAIDAADEDTRKACLTRHARQVREQIAALSAKEYWNQFTPAPQFVILFLPAEPFLSAAALADPRLIEEAMEKHVVLATPFTLIAVLRTVAATWRQEQIAKSAQEVSDLGRTLYDRLSTFLGHLSNVGKRLKNATEAFNQAVGSLETRVLPSARRFRDLGAATSAELPEVEPVDTQPRELAAPEAAEPDETDPQ